MKNLGSRYEDDLIRFALWQNLDSLVLENYFRFLLGRRLSVLMTGKIKCISWYENIAADKNFYLGGVRNKVKTKMFAIFLPNNQGKFLEHVYKKDFDFSIVYMKIDFVIKGLLTKGQKQISKT